ncbi:hypothetical protein SDC9_163283 [bioreactor metagenome]|uniref:Uncharacterized protein n=1 Tax=bioreactor metagenome TaxID=1076179 RepID=A0A645FNE5_9ZZZZ
MRFLFLGKSEHIVSSKSADFQGLNGQFKIVNGRCRACEMKNIIDFVTKVDWFCNIVFDVCKFIRYYMFNVFQVTC